MNKEFIEDRIKRAEEMQENLKIELELLYKILEDRFPLIDPETPQSNGRIISKSETPPQPSPKGREEDKG